MTWEWLSGDPELLFRLRPPDSLLAEMVERAAATGLGEPSLEVCRLLEILAGEASVRRILEVGRGLGVSTLCLARAATGAEVVSLDRTEDHLEATSEGLRRAGVEDRVNLVTGELLATVAALEDHFELAHLSIPSAGMLRLIDHVLPKLAVGGLLTVEGLRPVDEAALDRARAIAGYLVMHPQLQAQVLPIGEGLGVARKKKPLVTELGGPY